MSSPSEQKTIIVDYPKFVPVEKMLCMVKRTHLVNILHVQCTGRSNQYTIGYHDPVNLVYFGSYAYALVEEIRSTLS